MIGINNNDYYSENLSELSNEKKIVHRFLFANFFNQHILLFYFPIYTNELHVWLALYHTINK